VALIGLTQLKNGQSKKTSNKKIDEGQLSFTPDNFKDKLLFSTGSTSEGTV
jgi:hypothetical protein